MSSDGSPGRWLAGTLLFAGLTRLLYLLSYRARDIYYDALIHDARRYHDWASALADGRAWEAGPYYQAPLYPYSIAALYRLFGPEPPVIYAAQLGFGLITIWLVFRVTRAAFGARPAIAAGLLAACYGVLPFYETKLLPASLSVLLAALLLERLQSADRSARAWAWLLPGLVLGCAGLTNPSSLLAGPATALWIAVDRRHGRARRASRVVLFAAGVALLVLPVTVRNWRASGELVLISANGGITFYQGNNRFAEGVFTRLEGFSGSIFTQREESRDLARRETGRSLSDGEVSRFWFAKGAEFITGDPLAWTRLVARKLLLALSSEEQPLEYNPRLDSSPVRWILPLPFAVILALAALRLLARRSILRAEAPLYILLGAQACVLLAFYVSGRYRLPAMPALLALAGCGSWVLLERLRAGLARAAGALCVGGGVALFALACFPLIAGPLRARQEAMGLSDRAAVLLAAGRTADAVSVYRAATQRDRTYPLAHLDLAKALAQAGDLEAAERSVREAIRLAPALAEAWLALGRLELSRRRLGEAANAFAEAWRLDPASAAAGNDLAGTLITLGRRAQAIGILREMRRRGLAVSPPIEAWMREQAP